VPFSALARSCILCLCERSAFQKTAIATVQPAPARTHGGKFMQICCHFLDDTTQFRNRKGPQLTDLKWTAWLAIGLVLLSLGMDAARTWF
jgi:hypothetical protein